jgi:hypothetical protein
MSIDIAKLEPGDLIFQYIGTDVTEPKAIKSSHAMIFVGGDLGDLPTIVHQIGTSTLPTGTHRDVLVPNSQADTPTASTQRKRVLRCENSDLATRAAEVATKLQKQFQVSFSEDRAGASETFENKIIQEWGDADGLVFMHRRLFQSVGKFRAIKYAARRDGFLCYPGEEDYPGKGMHCSMFAAVCYQVAGLCPVVDAADGNDPRTRVTDKKMFWGGFDERDHLKTQGFKVRNETDWIMYGMYVKTLCEHDFYGISKKDAQRPNLDMSIKYVPSIMYWKGKTSIENANWDELITKGMQVDAKVIKATSLYQSLRQKESGWRDLGDLTGEKRLEDGKVRVPRLQGHATAMSESRKVWLQKK